MGVGVTERERERLILRNWLTRLQSLGKSEIWRVDWQAREPGEASFGSPVCRQSSLPFLGSRAFSVESFK